MYCELLSLPHERIFSLVLIGCVVERNQKITAVVVITCEMLWRAGLGRFQPTSAERSFDFRRQMKNLPRGSALENVIIAIQRDILERGRVADRLKVSKHGSSRNSRADIVFHLLEQIVSTLYGPIARH